MAPAEVEQDKRLANRVVNEQDHDNSQELALPMIEPIALRTRQILRESYALIGQTNDLRATAIPLLNGFDEIVSVESNTIDQAKHDHLRDNGGSLLNWAVDSAIKITNATKGNLQIFDTASGTLHMAAHRGFKQPFLDFFKCVQGAGTACGKAFDAGERVIVKDVTESPIFYGTPALEVLLDASVRAVQSTPLVNSSGAILGILSTHWISPRRLSNQSWVQLDVLACTVAGWLEHRYRAYPSHKG